MSATLYLSQIAATYIKTAEVELNRHLAVTLSGLCVTCAEPEPCRARYAALHVLLRYGILPKRRPGVAGVRSAADLQPINGFVVDHTRSNAAR
jgi:hypothetical protein